MHRPRSGVWLFTATAWSGASSPVSETVSRPLLLRSGAASYHPGSLPFSLRSNACRSPCAPPVAAGNAWTALRAFKWLRPPRSLRSLGVVRGGRSPSFPQSGPTPSRGWPGPRTTRFCTGVSRFDGRRDAGQPCRCAPRHDRVPARASPTTQGLKAPALRQAQPLRAVSKVNFGMNSLRELHPNLHFVHLPTNRTHRTDSRGV